MSEFQELTVEVVRKLFEYDPATGILTWRPKPGSTPDQRRWNSRHAGKEAGGPTADGHRKVRVGPRIYLVHRIIWLLVTGSWPLNEVDHINVVGDDNSWTNLREATPRQNRANRRPRANKSGAKGVRKSGQKWEARIGGGGSESLGTFDTKDAAAKAYAHAAKRRYGEFARTTG